MARDLLPGTPLRDVYESASHEEIKASYCTVAAGADGCQRGAGQQEKFSSWSWEGMSFSASPLSACEACRPSQCFWNCATGQAKSRGKSTLSPGTASACAKSAVAISLSTWRRGKRANVIQRELAPVICSEADRWRIDCGQIAGVPSVRASSHGTFRDLITRDLCTRPPSESCNRRITSQRTSENPRVALKPSGYVKRSPDASQKSFREAGFHTDTTLDY